MPNGRPGECVVHTWSDMHLHILKKTVISDRGSNSRLSRRNSENKGHRVEYRGQMQSLGAGLRGTWSIRSSIGNYDGSFHLWPVMENWAADVDESTYIVDGACR